MIHQLFSSLSSSLIYFSRVSDSSAYISMVIGMLLDDTPALSFSFQFFNIFFRGSRFISIYLYVVRSADFLGVQVPEKFGDSPLVVDS